MASGVVRAALSSENVGSVCPIKSYYTPESLEGFFEKIQRSHICNEALFMELVNELLFESLIKEVFQAEQRPSPPDHANDLQLCCNEIASKSLKAAWQQSSCICRMP